MTQVFRDGTTFKRHTSLDVMTEVGAIDYENFVESFESIAPDPVKEVFKGIEESIGFKQFEDIFWSYIKEYLKFNLIDMHHLHYLFHYELEETFENVEKIISEFTPNISYTLNSSPNLIDGILDIVKYHIIGDKMDLSNKCPLYSHISSGVNNVDIEYIKKNVKYTEKIKKLSVSKFKWLLFSLLMTKHDLFMYRDEFTKKFIHQITNQHIIQDQIYVDAYIVNVGMLFEKILLFYPNFPESLFLKIQKIIGDNSRLGVDYSIWFNDMFSSREVADEFKNTQISGKIKDGRPFFFEVGTKTDNVNFSEWKEKLGPNRKIEENTEGGKVKSLTVKKKYKYGKKDDKGYNFFAIPGAKESIQ